MRKIVLALALSAVVLPLGPPAARACGDKSLRLGRGVRFRRTTNPASILIYISPNAAADALSKVPRLQSFLKKAGHRSSVVQGEGQLGEALGSARYDIVLSSLDEAAGLRRRLESSASRPALVPIVFRGGSVEASQYPFVVKNAGSGEDYLEAIEGAMKTRTRA